MNYNTMKTKFFPTCSNIHSQCIIWTLILFSACLKEVRADYKYDKNNYSINEKRKFVSEKITSFFIKKEKILDCDSESELLELIVEAINISVIYEHQDISILEGFFGKENIYYPFESNKNFLVIELKVKSKNLQEEILRNEDKRWHLMIKVNSKNEIYDIALSLTNHKVMMRNKFREK